VDGSTGVISASYEYGPFGEPIRISGTMGKANPFRFSTKFTDDETGLSYYGQRYYIPFTGRWMSRDPIEEEGGVNVYGFVSDDSVSRFDPIGLEPGRFGSPDPDHSHNKPPKPKYETSCDLWIQRDLEWPGHETLVGVGIPGTDKQRSGRDFRGEDWSIIIPSPGKWANPPVPMENDFSKYTYYSVRIATSGSFKAGRANGTPCKCFATCANIKSCLDAATAVGTGSRFHGLGCYGNNCRTAIDAALAKCCARRGNQFTQAQ
jgi:RHS repeat-associated protein